MLEILLGSWTDSVAQRHCRPPQLQAWAASPEGENAFAQGGSGCRPCEQPHSGNMADRARPAQQLLMSNTLSSYPPFTPRATLKVTSPNTDHPPAWQIHFPKVLLDGTLHADPTWNLILHESRRKSRFTAVPAATPKRNHFPREVKHERQLHSLLKSKAQQELKSECHFETKNRGVFSYCQIFTHNTQNCSAFLRDSDNLLNRLSLDRGTECYQEKARAPASAQQL